MNTRGLAVLATLVVVVSGVSATAAFTAVSAERAVVVEVVGDADQLLGLTPHAGPNGKYSYQDGDDIILRIDVSPTNPNGDVRGVGKRTTTRFDDVFNVTNQGTQPVFVWIESSQFQEVELSYYGINMEMVMVTSITDPENAVEIGPGETLEVGFAIRTSADAEGRIAGSIVIHASTTVDPDAPDGR